MNDLLDNEPKPIKSYRGRKILGTILTCFMALSLGFCFSVFQSRPGLGYLAIFAACIWMAVIAAILILVLWPLPLRYYALVTSLGAVTGTGIALFMDSSPEMTMRTGQSITGLFLVLHIALIVILWARQNEQP